MRAAWGKIDKESGDYHPLAHHSMDVAAVFLRMLQLPVISGSPQHRSRCACDATDSSATGHVGVSARHRQASSRVSGQGLADGVFGPGLWPDTSTKDARSSNWRSDGRTIHFIR